MTEANTQRVQRQKQAPITVVIGNPPYNMNQQNENDNNKNRKYAVIDRRVAETYAHDSTASNKGALSDPYVKFFRWATDRLQRRDGIVAFVSNNSFVDQYAFDGMRTGLLQDFSEIYHADLHGNVRRNPKLSGTTHNVFGIRVGVGITVAVRRGPANTSKLNYYRLPENWRKTEKLTWLSRTGRVSGVEWNALSPGAATEWIKLGEPAEFEDFIPIGSKAVKAQEAESAQTIFKTFSRGIETARDEWAYAFGADQVGEKAKKLIETYNSELDRWRRARRPVDVDSFVTNDPSKIKWSSRLKEAFQREVAGEFSEIEIRVALYRPFAKRYVYFDPIFTHRRGIFSEAIPNSTTENLALCCTDHLQIPFSAQMTDCTPDFAVGGRAGQCFPFFHVRRRRLEPPRKHH
jgi:predicted helicase